MSKKQIRAWALLIYSNLKDNNNTDIFNVVNSTPYQKILKYIEKGKLLTEEELQKLINFIPLK